MRGLMVFLGLLLVVVSLAVGTTTGQEKSILERTSLESAILQDATPKPATAAAEKECTPETCPTCPQSVSFAATPQPSAQAFPRQIARPTMRPLQRVRERVRTWRPFGGLFAPRSRRSF